MLCRILAMSLLCSQALDLRRSRMYISSLLLLPCSLSTHTILTIVTSGSVNTGLESGSLPFKNFESAISRFMSHHDQCRPACPKACNKLSNNRQRRSPHSDLQQYGMTRNESPVYLMYPPDPSGRRAHEAIQLQSAGPSQRAAYETNPRATNTRRVTTPQPSEASPPTASTRQMQGQMLRTSATSGASKSTIDERPIIRSASDYTSSEGSSEAIPRQHTPRTRTVFWHCCQGRNSDHGPYNGALCQSCLTCGHQLCAYCRQEIVVVRDRGAPSGSGK